MWEFAPRAQHTREGFPFFQQQYYHTCLQIRYDDSYGCLDQRRSPPRPGALRTIIILERIVMLRPYTPTADLCSAFKIAKKILSHTTHEGGLRRPPCCDVCARVCACARAACIQSLSLLHSARKLDRSSSSSAFIDLEAPPPFRPLPRPSLRVPLGGEPPPPPPSPLARAVMLSGPPSLSK